MIISIASQKGGTGKTTTSITLAAGLARRGKTVLLVDIDSQANSSKVLLPNYPEIPKEQTIYATILHRKPLAIHPTPVPNLDIVPSHILLSNTDIELTTALDHREARLKQQLDTVRANYDYVFVDCPPTLSWLTINAFTASDRVIVVIAPGYFELDSIVQISSTISEVRAIFNPHLELFGFLFTMSDPTINTATSLQLLRQAYTGKVFTTVIPRNTDIRDAHFQRQDIFAYNPKAKAALAYDKLIRELFPPMRKTLNIAGIKNELRESSLFFQAPPARPTPLPVQSKSQGQTEADSTETRIHGNVEPRNRATTEPRFQGTTDTRLGSEARRGGQFDLNQPPTTKYTLAFTTEELEALDDLKTELRRKHGLKVAKNDLVRSALHQLLQDYEERGEQSALFPQLRKKQNR